MALSTIFGILQVFNQFPARKPEVGIFVSRESRLETIFRQMSRQDGSNELLFVKFEALDRQLKKVHSKNTSLVTFSF